MLLILKRLMIFDKPELVPNSGLAVRQDVQSYLIKALFAALPCVALAAIYFGPRIILMIFTAFLAGASIEIIFGLIRKKPIGGGVMVFSILLVLMLPPQIPLWMVALGSAFGILFGKEVFGGTGHHIFHPVLISKGFLMFSYPKIVKGTYFGSMLEFSNPNAWMVCSIIILLGCIAIIFVRRSNLLILGGIFVSGIVLGLILKESLPYDSVIKLLAADGFLFGACFLACDPAISPQNKIGKLIYGIIIGSAAVLMRSFSDYTEAMLSAILLGNLFAPTIDALSSIKTKANVKVNSNKGTKDTENKGKM